MKHPALTVALALALLVPAAPAAAAERCTKGRDVAADVLARVYTVKARWYACARTDTRPLRLAGVRRDALARAAHPYVAVTAGRDRVRLFDLTARSKAGMRVPGRVTDLLLSPAGLVTVVAGGQVLRMNAQGHVARLDEGAIEPGSLAASRNGAHLYWTRDGAARTAMFPKTPALERPTALGPRCGRSRTRTYAADAGGWLAYEPRRNEWVGCLNRGGRRVWFPSSDDAYLETIAAPFVAVVLLGFSPYGSGENEVLVQDLRDGEASASYNAHSWVSQLELTHHGTAYILEAGAVDIDGQLRGPPELFRMERGRRVRKLDEGAITVGSLALSPDGRRAYYLKDGVPLRR